MKWITRRQPPAYPLAFVGLLFWIIGAFTISTLTDQAHRAVINVPGLGEFAAVPAWASIYFGLGFLILLGSFFAIPLLEQPITLAHWKLDRQARISPRLQRYLLWGTAVGLAVGIGLGLWLAVVLM